MAKAWEGVFREKTDPIVEKFTQSIDFDRRLARQDIAGSIAHARMLAQVGLISTEECDKIVETLREIESEIESGKFHFSEQLEDIHLNIERALIDRLGDTGRKIHTARSRNDQVATDFRLWIMEAIGKLDQRLLALQQAFVDRCDQDSGIVLPAYTHLRRAQPVLAAHYWLAYCEKFQRDRDRLADCRRRVAVSPLGACALAGTSLPIDRYVTAQQLGFLDVAANSLDAVSDRDFALEFVFALAVVALHLSGWAEEWILWSSEEFRFLELPEAFCTGSSIMPQKINPDVLELIRGKSARVVGDLQTLLMLVKSLPLAYNRDLQEDKPPVFDAFDTVDACLEVAIPLVQKAKLRQDAISERLESGYLDATTLMEYLIKKEVPQRTAHELVGRIVRHAMDQGKRLAELPLEQFRQFCPHIDEDVYRILGAKNAVNVICSYGSTGPEEVARQVARWKHKLASETASQGEAHSDE